MKLRMGANEIELAEDAIDAFMANNPEAVAALRRVHGDDKLREAVAKRMYHEKLIARPPGAYV